MKKIIIAAAFALAIGALSARTYNPTNEAINAEHLFRPDMTTAEKIEWAESLKQHVSTGKHGNRNSGSHFTKQERKIRHHMISANTAIAMHSNTCHQIQRRQDIKNFKDRWLDRHEGATEADFEEWRKLSRFEKIQWDRAWKEKHESK